MDAINDCQDLHLRLLERAEFNDLDGPRVAADLRANTNLWRAALLTNLTTPVYEKLDNPFNRTSPPAPLLNRVDLLVLRDIPKNYISCDTLILWSEPGRQDELDTLAQRWRASELVWHNREETRRAMKTTKFQFKEYESDSRVLLRLLWT